MILIKECFFNFYMLRHIERVKQYHARRKLMTEKYVKFMSNL